MHLCILPSLGWRLHCFLITPQYIQALISTFPLKPCGPPSPRHFWTSFSSTYHSLASRPWWCPSPGTLGRVIAHIWLQMHFPSVPRETPGSLTVSSVEPSGSLLTSWASRLQGLPTSWPSCAFLRVPSSPSMLYWLCLPPPCSSSLQSWNRWVQWPKFFCGWFYN